jgi:hypothetical protein
MNTLRPQVKKNVSSLRKGLGWFATLVGVALLIVLVGCPEDDSSSSSSPVTVALTNEATGNLTVMIRASELGMDDTTVWAIVFPDGTTLAGDLIADQIANVKNGGVSSGVDSAEMPVGSLANVMTDITSADKTEDLVLPLDVTLSGAASITVGTSYVVYVVIGNDTVDVDRVSSRLVVTATDGTAPTATIVAESVNSATSGVGSITATFTGLSEPATAYWIVVDDGACPTDVASVKDVPASGEIAIAFTAANGGGPVRGSTEIDNDADTDVSNVIMITGAAPGISGGTHDLCIVLEDAAGNAGDVLTQILTP